MQVEKVDSNDDEKSSLGENIFSSDTKEDENSKEIENEEEKARVNDRRRFKSEEDPTEEDSTEEKNKDESPSLVPSYVELLEKKVLIAEEKLQEHIARVNKESKEFRKRQEKDL